MTPASEAMLVKVHPDLVKVVRRADLITKQPFAVIHGIRTVAEEEANVASGHSQTMHSRHFPNKQGFACAVDVMALGPWLKADWNPVDYQPIAAAMLSAAHEFSILIEWGGNWKTLKDWGHFQLPWSVYP